MPHEHAGNFYCLYPFLELRFDASGRGSPCCAYNGFIKNGDKELSLYDNSLGEIWDAESQVKLRHTIATGQVPAECASCQVQESRNGSSLRTEMTAAFESGYLNEEKRSVAQVVQSSQACNHLLSDGPERLYLQVGTTCNLRCRMCNGSSSSAIAQDKLQSSWISEHFMPLRWSGHAMRLYPGLYGDVFLEPASATRNRRAPLVITRDRSQYFSFPHEAGASELAISLQSHDQQNPGQVIFSFDGIESSHSLKRSGKTVVSLPLAAPMLEEQNLHCLSISASPAIELVELALRRAPTPAHGVIGARSREWHSDAEFLEQRLFDSCGRLRMLYLMGGEPTLIKQVRHLLRELIASGQSNSIRLGITTNATSCDQEWLDLLAKFGSVHLALSIDGFGAVNKYIRHGADWSAIRRSIELYRGIPSIYSYVHCTLQAYNMFHVSELASFSASESIGFRFYELNSPRMLSIGVMPQDLRVAAANRINGVVSRWWHTDHNGEQIRQQLRLIAVTLQHKGASDGEELENFRSYTAEIDQDRSEKLADVNPELNSYLMI